MKTFIKILFSLLLPLAGVAQDLSSFEPVAHYSLKNTAADMLGMRPDIELINAPFVGNDGVYSNGQYFGGSTNPCLIRTPHLAALYDTSFAVQLEFMIDTLDGSRPVFICGDGWRYLGLGTHFTQKWLLEFDGLSYTVPDLTPEAKRWYSFTLVYSTLDSTAHYYLDGAKIGERKGVLSRPNDDGKISNNHFGSGLAFLGNWRELKVFRSGQVYNAVSKTKQTNLVKIFPNPAGDFIRMETNERVYGNWLITDLAGKHCKTGVWQPGEMEIDISDLAQGVYFLQSTDHSAGGSSVACFIKP